MARPVGAARLRQLPPYLFAQIEQKIAAKRAAGVDIISLGIGDPDTPTPPYIVDGMRDQVARADTHQYPSNRGRESFRGRGRLLRARFGVTLDPATQIIPAMGAKEAVANVNLALLDPGDVALASDPGYPVYTTGPLLAGAEPVPMPLLAELGFQPDLEAIPADVLSARPDMFLSYPNNPTAASSRTSTSIARSRSRRRTTSIVSRQRLLRDRLRRLPRTIFLSARAPRTWRSSSSR